MLRSLLCTLLMCTVLPTGAAADCTETLRSGEWLRFHVIAHDDTPSMQQVKLLVRDSVQAVYASDCPDPKASMLENTRALLPLMEIAAAEAARSAGFSGEISFCLTCADFPAYDLGGFLLPPGRYPALMIRLGEGKGHNWWGLIDPGMALWSSSLPSDASPEALPGAWQWDWSLEGFFRALLSSFGIDISGEANDV